MRWNGVAANGNNHADVSNPYLLGQQPPTHGQALQSLQSPSPGPSNVLALREPSASRALIATAPRTTYDEQPEQWGTSANDGALVPAPNGTTSMISEEEHLRLLVARAKKIEEEATKENPGPNQKRSIPPFVLKLARFVFPSSKPSPPRGGGRRSFAPWNLLCPGPILLTGPQLSQQWQEQRSHPMVREGRLIYCARRR